jgi:hypothetical protein
MLIMNIAKQMEQATNSKKQGTGGGELVGNNRKLTKWFIS